MRALVAAEETERRRIVGSLHDDIGQPLYRVLYGLEGCRARLDEGSPVATELDRLADLVRDVDQTLHDELRHLHRGVLDDLDLGTSLVEIVRRASEERPDVTWETRIETDHDPGPEARSAVLRAAREGVTNVQKHAHAERAAVSVYLERDRLRVDVLDDGSGPNGHEGLGLSTSRERLEALGGGLDISPRMPSGTVLRAWVPLEGKA